MRAARGKRRRQVGHIDDWLMTYADMITLLLCFFAIFLSVSVPRKDIPQKIQLPQPVEQPTKLPDILEGNLPFHGVPRTWVPTKALPDDETPPADPVKTEKKGDRLTTIEVNSAAFFDRGSATLSDTGKRILQDVSASLTAESLKGYQITVEGHTDDIPISTPQFPSNWELSTARAAAVVHFFLDHGIPARRLRAAGYADTFPKVPNRDLLGGALPENQAQNRRVVIKLEKIEKSE